MTILKKEFAMWTKEGLEEAIKEKMADYRLVVVSNRQPYGHLVEGGKVICRRQPGGLVTALNPVMRTAKGTWIAVGTSSADRAMGDRNGKVSVPPEDPSYTLRRVFLSKEDTDAYYDGYCNEGLWPLSHMVYARPHFIASDWEAYQRVNRAFAEALLDEVDDTKTFIWVQDFHLTLVAKYLREAGCSHIITSLFWHVPWPNPEVFGICPQKKEILEGLLSYDLLGFQIRSHADNFLATVDKELESRIDREKISVNYQNRETLIRPFPISVDFNAISLRSESPEIAAQGKKIQEEFSLKDKRIILSVDRLDYTKGIPDKFRAFDRFLEKYPAYKEKVVLFQLGEISRIRVPRYQELNDELIALVEKINWKHSQNSWVPIVLNRSYMSYEDILALYRTSDVCVVSSLHDGMNLVSKEFVASRSDLGGVLVLSEFTGAARELKDALLINPYDPESFADTLHQALNMPEEERQKRMGKMRQVVAENNIYRWTGKVLSNLMKFEFQEVLQASAV